MSGVVPFTRLMRHERRGQPLGIRLFGRHALQIERMHDATGHRFRESCQHQSLPGKRAKSCKRSRDDDAMPMVPRAVKIRGVDACAGDVLVHPFDHPLLEDHGCAMACHRINAEVAGSAA